MDMEDRSSRTELDAYNQKMEYYKNKMEVSSNPEQVKYYEQMLYQEMTAYAAKMSQCPIIDSKNRTSQKMIQLAMEEVKNSDQKKVNLIWLESTGCSGNIISFLNAEFPSALYVLQEMVTLRYNNSLMAAQGEAAFQQFLDTLDTEFILVVEGAVSTKDNGIYSIMANYKGKRITIMEGVKMAGEKAKYILAAGTCASYGGISSARPNPSGSMSVADFLKKDVIRIPGCPSHPDWVIGTLAHLVAFGKPELDSDNRPVLFYGITIHDKCPRRSFFERGLFAQKLGEEGCMFQLGCRGPVTKTDCPVRHWNSYVNWPVQNNTTCIGCAQQGFPDGMEPFVRF